MTAKRKAARRPTPRTVAVTIAAGDFEGWACTARADFPAAWLVELQSGDVGRIVGALERIIQEHNFPDVEGDVATSLSDVDPFQGILAVLPEITEAIGRLPPR